MAVDLIPGHKLARPLRVNGGGSNSREDKGTHSLIWLVCCNGGEIIHHLYFSLFLSVTLTPTDRLRRVLIRAPQTSQPTVAPPNQTTGA